MPFWCNNAITITPVSPDSLREFRNTLVPFTKTDGSRVVFSFVQVLPQPATDKGPHWNEMNWGTQADATKVKILVNTDQEVKITCVTPWTYPQYWASYVATHFGLKVEIHFSVEGSLVRGIYTVEPNAWNEEIIRHDPFQSSSGEDSSTEDELSSDLDEGEPTGPQRKRKAARQGRRAFNSKRPKHSIQPIEQRGRLVIRIPRAIVREALKQ